MSGVTRDKWLRESTESPIKVDVTTPMNTWGGTVGRSEFEQRLMRESAQKKGPAVYVEFRTKDYAGKTRYQILINPKRGVRCNLGRNMVMGRVVDRHGNAIDPKIMTQAWIDQRIIRGESGDMQMCLEHGCPGNGQVHLAHD